MKYERKTGKILQIDTDRKIVVVGVDEYYYNQQVEQDLINGIQNNSEIEVLIEGKEDTKTIIKVTHSR